MKHKYKKKQIQKLICLFLLCPLILGISISGMRASTQALYGSWNLQTYELQDSLWKYEMLDDSVEKEEKDRTGNSAQTAQDHEIEENTEETILLRQLARDRVLLGMPETELNHAICLDEESLDLALPRADEYQVWFAEEDIGQRQTPRISDTENATMLHTGYIINKNMKKGHPLKDHLEPSGDHIYNNEKDTHVV